MLSHLPALYPRLSTSSAPSSPFLHFRPTLAEKVSGSRMFRAWPPGTPLPDPSPVQLSRPTPQVLGRAWRGGRPHGAHQTLPSPPCPSSLRVCHWGRWCQLALVLPLKGPHASHPWSRLTSLHWPEGRRAEGNSPCSFALRSLTGKTKPSHLDILFQGPNTFHPAPQDSQD